MRTQTIRCIISLLALAVPAFAAEPFALPWDDASPGSADFSALNSPITPESRVAVDRKGHFVAAGQRIRFLGVNCAGDSPFMPTNKADGAAARMAKFGINSVRLHHMDSSWAVGGGIIQYTPETSTNINPAQLEKLHFFVSRLKAHGIYADVNLLVGRDFKAGDGLGPEVDPMDWKDGHILAFFNDTALALQKDYATKLLTPTNPFTGLSLAKDPAVAFVEILNENGIVQNWLDGGLDRLPLVYERQLQKRWNDWLRARYANDAAMLAAWHAVQEPLGVNYLKNGSFTDALKNWNCETHESARADFTPVLEFTDGRPAVKISVTQPSRQSWHVQLNQAGLSVENGRPYTITFWARSAEPAALDVTVMRSGGDWGSLGFVRKFHLTQEWQQFSATFAATATETNARVNFGGMGNSKAVVSLAQVIFQPGGALGVPPGPDSLEKGLTPNIAHAGNGFAATLDARRDWLRFLRDLEVNYYDAMVGHLHTNIGYPGLIFGTIMANSPATVQSRMDVIDGHAYWQHPQFPGKPWDSMNWNVPNISLVNTLGDDNTLAGLARQRIVGKPFTVTEYQHPSPNSYSAEGPLLLAAYAALQDWDGLWLFDYGPGYNPQGGEYIAGYFSMMNHPAKMANMLLAANLFRRADISPAKEQFSTTLTPEQEVRMLAQSASAWSVFSAQQLGMQRELAFIHRVGTTLADNTASNSIPDAGAFGKLLTSDTGELAWDLTTAGHGVVTVNTPKTKALVGFADDKDVSLGGVTFHPRTTQLGWCSLGVTLRRGESLTNACSALIVSGGWCENSGQVWTSAKKDSVANQWGHAPVLAEIVPFTLTLPVSQDRVHVWKLDERGQRKSAMTLEGDASKTILRVTPENGSLWYELEVAAP